MKSVCEKCHHKKTCKRPCWPVEHLLAVENSAGLEKRTMFDGRIALKHFGGNKHEVRFSDLSQSALRAVMEEVPDNTISSDEREKELPFDPRLVQSGMFYRRFFLGWSYKDLGEAYGCDHREAASRCDAAKKRVMEILETLDGRNKGLFFINRIKKKLTTDQQAFLLNRVFGFSVDEISELPGYGGPDWLRKKINKMQDDLMVFFPNGAPDPKEVLAKTVKQGNGQFTKGVTHKEALAGVR